jgi:predicted ATPase/DNA-binding CsgD family transcriptional regulator
MNGTRAVRPAGNLPVLGSTFVGRQRELAEVRRQVEASRLVTLTGPGGVGKTRLAIQAGELMRRAFPDGVWIVDLATINDPALLADTIVAALGAIDRSAQTALEQLARHLAQRQLLLVLDNCEHLLPACAEVACCVLHRAPGLRVLATSRQPLQLPGEHVLIVNPLPAPAPDSALPTDLLARYESVGLLIDRAMAVQPGFTVHDANRGAVARLCARLDGLPLAIELAATRLRSLSVEQVADRLDDRFRLLNQGSPAALPRQRTLRALMDWSYDLCSEQEQQLWARLSVFPGDFDLAAAEATCAGSGLPRDVILDRLDELVAKSVVSARPETPAARYRMLETIRQYGRERLNRSGLTRQLQQRHRDYYLRLADESCSRWYGPDQTRLLATLRLEHDNLLTALEWSLTEDNKSTALKLVSALRYHWVLNYPATGRRRLDQVLSKAPDPSPQRGEALWVAAWVARIQGDTKASATWRLECADIASQYGSDHLQAYVQLLTGSMTLFTGHPPDAVERLAASLALLRKQRDVPGILIGLFLYGLALSHSGDSPAAQAACTEAIALADERGELWARAEAFWVRAFDLWKNGDPEENAAELAREALRSTPDANPASTVIAVELLAWIAGSRGEHGRAVRLLGAAAAQWQSLGTAIDSAFPLHAGHSGRCRAAALDALGKARFSTEFELGRARPLEALNADGAAPAPASAAAASAPLLTRREWEVAGLIAQGYTNKAIAAELVLSPHTVGGHVERLFSKLGISTRAQVATWLAQHHDQAPRPVRAHSYTQ